MTRRIEAVLAAALAAGCSGDTLRLGEQTPALLTVLGEPERLTELCGEGKNDNPTLTGDLLEIYFASTRAGGLGDADVWSARRGSSSEAFGSPQLVKAVSSDTFDTSPAISPDGLTLWLGSGGDGAYKVDIYETTRPNRDTDQWYPPRNVEVLNSEEDDIPRPLGQHDQVMPLASRRDNSQYATFFAARGPDGSLGAPQPVPELAVAGCSLVDGCLTNDGLILVFNAEPAENQGDLYLARRSSTAVPFEAPIPLDQLNTPGDDRDPWASLDESLLFLSSDRGGALCIYQVPVRVRR